MITIACVNGHRWQTPLNAEQLPEIHNCPECGRIYLVYVGIPIPAPVDATREREAELFKAVGTLIDSQTELREYVKHLHARVLALEYDAVSRNTTDTGWNSGNVEAHDKDVLP